ncbi:beta-lactamase family protein [Lysobacter soli]|uniref:serine hydrolase domain-containing protein n=1 Tax=Lysobacter soli TaxID=453783 RepID=UPI0020A06DA2|nr:serine hydrolase domain-containing protein [Lysobacter soli]UTA55207.1 beta-lactamase family protein [Lysobacter soli]
MFQGALRRLECTLALLALPFAGSAAALHDTMAQQLTSQGLQGAVWSTLVDGSVATGAAGTRDARTGKPMQASDRVHVGSVAKTLLATGVLRLVTQGKLALDTPVAPLLPEIEFDNPWASTDPIRIRHLLDHTAGLDDVRFSQAFTLAPREDTPLRDAFDGRGPLRVRSRPGARHSYSNTSYTLLGMVVERITGTRYETYLDAYLLAPLRMHDSTFGFTTQDGERADPRLAMGHFEHGATHAAVPSYIRPAGQFTTTAADMGRLARFLMSDGRIDGAPFIDAPLLRAMGEPVATEAADAGLRVGYGLGLSTRDRHGVVGRCHGGSTVGYRAMLCLFPREQRAFFIAVNADVEGVDYGKLDRRLIEALHLPASPPQHVSGTVRDLSEWNGIYVPSPNRFASLDWLDATLNFVHVTHEGDALRFKPFQGKELALHPVGDRLLRAPERVIASHALVIASDGRRVVSTGLQSYERAPLARMVLLWASLVAGLLGCVWLLASGVHALIRRRTIANIAVLIPFSGLLALLLPLPFFYRQSFLQLGDVTTASVLLAIVTALWPLTMLVGLIAALLRGAWSMRAKVDVIAMLAVLQWTCVLAWWGLVPLWMWA